MTFLNELSPLFLGILALVAVAGLALIGYGFAKGGKGKNGGDAGPGKRITYVGFALLFLPIIVFLVIWRLDIAFG